jgi:hypothetical protein
VDSSLVAKAAARSAADSSRSESTLVILAYAVTIFTSAFLLFQVQPLISKFILPWFGGSPAVWTAAMLFFQVVLFGGYLYAHLASTYLGPRAQLGVHWGLLVAAAIAVAATQITPGEALKPTGKESSPLAHILLVLGASVGLPYFTLSSTGPLLQKWFSDALGGVSPYRLFALSNVGSLLALVSYPFFFEVYWDVRQQALMWSLGFVLFAACCALCAWWTYRARQLLAIPRAGGSDSSAAHAAPAWWQRASWLALPALASLMFLAVTNEVCQNVAAVPLLWILPLSLYLLSFIVAFDHPRWYVRPLCAGGAIVLAVYLSNFDEFSEQLGAALTRLAGRDEDNPIVLGTWIEQSALYFLDLFLICLVCHCELAALRPAPRYLTSYYLSMSLGGAIGGLLVNLVAPHLFDTFFELPLGMLAAVAVCGGALAVWLRRWGQRAGWGAVPLAAGALAAVAWWQIGWPAPPDPQANRATLYRGRNFFGLVAVEHRSRNDPEWENLTFLSGHIVHGRQFVRADKRQDTNIAYWGPKSGCRRAIEFKLRQKPGCRIGVVGLGVGTIAGFARPGDYVRMYEINPEVIEIAQRYFTFLRECPAPVDIVLGDARLQLERELEETGGRGQQFDVLCLDAFTGDAVPTHLLTSEAFAIYKQHLKPDGILVCNITNTYLDLYPVVAKLAAAHGLKHTRIYQPRDLDRLIYRTYFVLVTNDEEFLAQTPEELVDMPASFRVPRDVPLWTDRYHNLFQVLR